MVHGYNHLKRERRVKENVDKRLRSLKKKKKCFTSSIVIEDHTLLWQNKKWNSKKGKQNVGSVPLQRNRRPISSFAGSRSTGKRTGPRRSEQAQTFTWNTVYKDFLPHSKKGEV